MPNTIPTVDARRISRDRAVPMVLIFGLDAAGDLDSVVTHGASDELGDRAGWIADQVLTAVRNGTIKTRTTEVV